MEPTFQNGDALLLKKWGVPKKDDIIIAYIEELDLMVVKRILAIEGDVVSIDEMWDGINELDLMTLTEMGKDGYLFEIENGRIQNILMVTGILK